MAGHIRANPTKNRAMRYNAKEHLMDVYYICDLSKRLKFLNICFFKLDDGRRRFCLKLP